MVILQALSPLQTLFSSSQFLIKWSIDIAIFSFHKKIYTIVLKISTYQGSYVFTSSSAVSIVI